MKSTRLLRAVYIAAKWNGFAPFRLSASFAYLTDISTSLAICAAIGLNIIFMWSQSKFLVNANYDQFEETFLFVAKLDICATLMRNLIISILLIVKRNEMVQIINDIYHIALNIKHFRKIQSFLDQQSMRRIRLQILAMFYQLAVFVLSAYIQHRNCARNINFDFFRVFIFSFINNFFQITLSSMHFTAFLSVLQLYRHINENLKQCVKHIRSISKMNNRRSIRMQVYCDVSDQIDEIASYYKYVTICNQRICKVFSGSMLMILSVSFVLMISTVRFVFCIFFKEIIVLL